MEGLDQRELLATFAAETREGIAGLETAVLSLERAPGDGELVRTIFRTLHTVKGNALSLGFPALAAFAHGLESALETVRAEETLPGPELIARLLASVDTLRGLLAEALNGRDREGAAPGLLQPASVPEGEESLRVGLRKLDRLLDLSGEIGVARGRLRREAQGGGAALREACDELDRLCQALQEEIIQVRAVPIGPTVHQHARTVRDAASAHGKSVRLEVEGGEVELDAAVLELVRDPLTQLLRNAVAHGIELPHERIARGKDPVGRVSLRAFHREGLVVVEVEDDGAGLDRPRIAAEVRARGQLDPDTLTDDQLFQQIFVSGLSTAQTVSELSGRGVGMDVVRHNIERLRGSIAIESTPGQGTRFTLRLPLTLAILDVFFLGAGDATWAIPLEAVVECLELRDFQPARRGGVIELRGAAVPFLRLPEHFGLEELRAGVAPAGSLAGAPAARGGALPVRRESLVVVQHGEVRCAIAADELIGKGQTVIKPLGALLRGARGVAGSALLASGQVALVLDIPALLGGELLKSR